MNKKIIIIGFPHCGTSILKSIIGHIDDVEEIYGETDYINKKTNKSFILCKYPFVKESFFEKEYEDYIKIFIVRNPLFVFSSLNKRFKYNIDDNHSIDKYINTLEIFIKYKNNAKKNIYTIRYEDIFDCNFQALRKIIDEIGMKYNDDIFDNSKYTNIHFEGVKLMNDKPNETQNVKYRTWQINKPFVSNNDISKIELTKIQKQKIINDPFILEVYPDIKL